MAPGHPLNLPPAPPLDVSSNPYRGLESFDEKHKDLFFGRKALTQQLAEFVPSHALTVVLGASGSGKSSLAKAGLIPTLRQVNDSIRDLSTAVNDARVIADLLEQQYAYKHSDEKPEVIRLFDEEATLEALKDLFDARIPNELNSGEGDRFSLTSVDERSSLIPYDSPRRILGFWKGRSSVTYVL